MRSCVLIHYSDYQFQIMSKYQGRIDPLDLLRNAYIDNKKIKLKDKYLIFQKDMRIPLSEPTAWISTDSKKTQYSLGALWLYLEYLLNREPNYVQKVYQYQVENVSISDRDEIGKYFLGKIQQSQCINQEIKIQLATKNTRVRAHPTTGFQDNLNDPSKKIKSDIPMQLQIIDYISKFQRPINSKTRSLRCQSKSFQNLLKLFQTNNNQQQTKTDDKKLRINLILQKKKYPIIIVPEHQQAGNIFLGNVENFLVNGEYIQNPLSSSKNHQRKLQFQYTLRGKKTTFDVTNNPSLLTPSDWQNVVAIFVQGLKNQFSTWFYRDPVQIFKRSKGFLLKYSNKQQKQNLDWNVKTFTLDRNVRYRDSGVQKAIWNEIQEFLYQKI